MADIAKSFTNLKDGSDAQQRVSVSLETVAVLLDGMTKTISELVSRVDTLEKLQQEGQREKETRKDAETRDDEEGSRDREHKKEAASPVVDEPAHEKGLLDNYVEFREEVYSESNLRTEWKVVDAWSRKETESSSQKKSFRYDTKENGNLVFSVFRTAKLYHKLLELCPPAHDGQVNLDEDRLEFKDVFPLLHCRESLQRYEPPDEATRQELEVLNELYEREGHLSYAQRRYDELLRDKKIDCTSLKGLFYRDQLVVFRELRDEWAVARVTTVTAGLEDEVVFENALELECKAIDFDGMNFRAHVYRREIKYFSGTRNITELPVYPLDFFHDKKKLIEDSIDSGRRWKRLHERLMTENKQPRAAVMQYVGYCETFDEMGARRSGDEDEGMGSELASRVIVDPTRYPDRYLHFTEDNEDPFKTKLADVDDRLRDPQNDPLVLCPEKILVHSLSDNEWYYVAMSKLKEPTWAPNAWSRLVKPGPAYGNVAVSIDRIQSLAEAHRHFSKRDDGVDNFTGKGKGLTFLLHGPPGVGKTMLAECLSEQQERPLYRINLGRLVADDRWESTIEEIFRQAHFWGAILLVDEAEVILAERTQENMHQSAWVAVFLRKVEYFAGIIFLTTNLIHMIDPAFISRVNLGFRIPDLDPDTRLEIWRKMLGELPESYGARWLIRDQKVMTRWAATSLNGRQIRNVIHSARLLANEGGIITADSIDACLRDVEDFINMIDNEKQEVELRHMSHWSS